MLYFTVSQEIKININNNAMRSVLLYLKFYLYFLKVSLIIIINKYNVNQMKYFKLLSLAKKMKLRRI